MTALPQPPFFSIIIPTYNYAHRLPRVLDSIYAQGGDDYEIVVVDDGSTDHTPEVIRSYVARGKGNLIYARQEHRGPSAARNHGIRFSTGQYVLFVDADDALLPTALDRFRSTLGTSQTLDFALGAYLLVGVDGRAKQRPAMRLLGSREANFACYLRNDLNIICCGCVVVHRRVFDRLRFPGSDMMWEDIIFWAHLLALYDGVSFPESVVAVHRHADSLSHNVERVRREYRKTLDALFNPAVLPADLMGMRQEFLSLTYLEYFSFMYKRGYDAEAVATYCQAIRVFPRHLLKLRPLRRYLSLKVGLTCKRQSLPPSPHDRNTGVKDRSTGK